MVPSCTQLWRRWYLAVSGHCVLAMMVPSYQRSSRPCDYLSAVLRLRAFAVKDPGYSVVLLQLIIHSNKNCPTSTLCCAIYLVFYKTTLSSPGLTHSSLELDSLLQVACLLSSTTRQISLAAKTRQDSPRLSYLVQPWRTVSSHARDNTDN